MLQAVRPLGKTLSLWLRFLIVADPSPAGPTRGAERRNGSECDTQT